MTPVLVTAPATHPVSLAEAKLQCRVDHADDDALLNGMIAAAVGHLDGWTGVLGRCIVSQTWRVQAEAGDVVLPMPDVVSASAAYVAGATALTITATVGGPQVTLIEDCTVTFVCAMPAHLLAVVKAAVLMIVAHWYENRETVGPSMSEVPFAATTLIEQMRWRRL